MRRAWGLEGGGVVLEVVGIGGDEIGEDGHQDDNHQQRQAEHRQPVFAQAFPYAGKLAAPFCPAGCGGGWAFHCSASFPETVERLRLFTYWERIRGSTKA